MKRIGSSFAEELKAAGLFGLRMSWGEDGIIEYASDIPSDVRAQVQAVYDAHDPDASDLAEAKRTRRDYINARRDAFIGSGVTFNGVEYDTDAQSVANLTAAVAFIQAAPSAGLSAQVPSAVSWRDKGNTDRNLSPSDLVGLGAVIFQRVQTAHFIARGLKDAIESAASVAAVNAVDWPA